jgi:Stress responsive A/B Barrel Domain
VEIPAIREYEVGPGLNRGNATLAINALFDDAEAFETYRSHPAHRAVAQEHLVPAMESARSIQFEV